MRELGNIIFNDTWSLVFRPPERQFVTSIFVTLKPIPNVRIQKHNAEKKGQLEWSQRVGERKQNETPHTFQLPKEP